MSQLVESLSFLSITFYKIGTWLDEKVEEFKRTSKIRSTITELNKLTDKELRDIGICRGEIYDIAHGAHPRANTNKNLNGWV